MYTICDLELALKHWITWSCILSVQEILIPADMGDINLSEYLTTISTTLGRDLASY